jgi:hypothetical protein
LRSGKTIGLTKYEHDSAEHESQQIEDLTVPLAEMSVPSVAQLAQQVGLQSGESKWRTLTS